MPRIPVDVTVVGLIPADNYVATISNIDYQVKTGDKWNKDGTTTERDHERWSSFPIEKRRIHYQLTVPGKGNLWYDLYLMDNALGFTKAFLKAANVPFGEEGFDPDQALGKEIGVTVSVEDDPEFGKRNVINKFYRP